ncbi:MAG: hypothetical protein ACOC1X_04970 [Promethearchaeota archaeon]
MPENVGSKTTRVNHKKLKMMIERKHESKVPLFIWGAPGIGKSDSVRQAAKSIAEKRGKEFVEISRETLDQEEVDIDSMGDDKFVLIDKRLSDHDPTEIKGLQKFDSDDQERTITSKPAWFPTKGDLEGMILFDELNLAPQLVQSAAYQIIHDRRLGKYQLPEGFSIISCGNRVKDRANIYEMGKPLQNRFSHVELREPSVEQWSEWAEKNGIDERLIGFLQNRQELLFQFDADDDMLKSFPTPRTVENTHKDICGIEYTDETKELIKKLVSSNVGRGWANEFITFLETKEKLNINEMIENPDSAELPNRPDLLYIIASSITEKYDSTGDDKYIKSVMKLMLKLEHDEFSKLMVRPLKNELGYEIGKVLSEADEKLWDEVCDNYAKYLLDDL